MPPMKFYAVAKGRTTGIFTSWPEAERQVKGFAGAKYKSFKTEKEAKAFLDNPVYSSAKKSVRSREPGSKAPSPAPKTYPETTVIVHTDGGAIGNPGPGGYGVVIKNGAQLSGGFNRTTNNRMELMGVIKALEALEGEKNPILLHSDSRYVINGITKGWANGWKKRGWKNPMGNRP